MTATGSTLCPEVMDVNSGGGDRKQRIVILGGGFGGAYCAQALSRRLSPGEAEVLLIDRRNFFVFYPFLVEAGTGNLDARHAVISLRAFSDRARFLMAEVVQVDSDRHTVSYRLTGEDAVQAVSYDHLVLAMGSVTNLPDIPGLENHGFGLKSLADAIGLRDRAVQMLELANAVDDPEKRAAILHFLVVGGNFTGVELVGEFHAFLRQATRRYPNVKPDDCRVTLVEIADRILPGLDRELSDYALQNLRRRGIDIRLQSTLSRIEAERVHIGDGDEMLPTRTVIWCAGIAQNPLLRRLDLPRTEQGWVLCEPDLRVKDHDHIWAIGDGAVNPDPEGDPYPPTAQHAVRQGKHLARNLAAVLTGGTAEPFVYTARGSIVGLGCRAGVARIGPLKLSGFAAWFIYRTVYLFKMPGWARRVRVALDWTVDLFFRRDHVALGLLGQQREDGRSSLQADADIAGDRSSVEHDEGAA